MALNPNSPVDPRRSTQYCLLRVAYKGTSYHGYQEQENAQTIAELLRGALSSVVDHPVNLRASSRTDAGVHALDLAVYFETSRIISMRGVVLGTNRLLPLDIRVVRAECYDAPMDPRRQSRGKIYRYHFWNGPVSSPLLADYAWHVPSPMDLERAEDAVQAICGKYDFSAFRARGCAAKHATRRIIRASLTRHPRSPHLLTFEVYGEAFLRHQVRILAGTIAEISWGLRAPDSMEALLKPGRRQDAGKTAPAHGLLLVKVEMNLPAPRESWPPGDLDSTTLFPVLNPE